MSRISFEKAKSKGRIAEQVFADYMKSRGKTLTDVTEDIEYQKQDIDFVDEKGITYEVKLDKGIPKTGNILVELYHIRSNPDGSTYKENGWLHKLEADYLIFYDGCRYMYALSVSKLKKNICKFRQISFYNTLDKCTTYLGLLDIKTVNQLGIIVKTIDIGRGVA